VRTALELPSRLLRGDGGGIEDRVAVVVLADHLRRGSGSRLGFSDTTTGCCQGSGCRRLIR
jgi:hypothetical protein